MLDNELIEIIRIKKFKNVWELLQYLIDIGFDENTYLEVIPNFFNENNYFDNVAYARKVMAIETRVNNNSIKESLINDTRWVLHIGLLDKSEYKLKRVFDIYKKGLTENKVTPHVSRRIEGLCKNNNMYEFKNLTSNTIDYFKKIAIKYYGYNLI
tara:strand:- start:4639 stop:5103 length:465 start_codon:yes stop_codon:yes gene_type:complete